MLEDKAFHRAITGTNGLKMSQFWTALLVLLLFASVLGRSARGVLGKDVLVPLRGIAIAVIVFYHMFPYVGSKMPVLGLIGARPAAVAVFLFLSGYGLIKQVGREGYLDGFLIRSAHKLFVPFLICLSVWCVYLRICDRLDMVEMLFAFGRRGLTPLPNSWYLFELYLFYGLFWVSFMCFNGIKAVLACTAMSVFAFVGLIISPWGCEWWLSCLAFPAGLMFSALEPWVVANRKKIAVGAAISLALLYVGGQGLNIHSATYNLLRVLWYAVFSASCALVMYRFAIPSRVFEFVGKISFELYLVHGCYVIAFKGLCNQPILYVVSVVAASILTAVVFHCGRQRLLNSKI